MIELAAGPLAARFAPEVGMVCASLTWEGEELLHPRKGLEAYRTTGSSMGIPLLHPWANRLGAERFLVDGVEVHAEPGAPGVRTDEHGLPIHGLLAASDRWQVTRSEAARLTAELDFGAQADLLAVFPFAHVIEIDVELEAGALRYTTAIRAERPLPVAFGYHPYLVAPDGWEAELPAMRHRPVDERGIPTGETAEAPAEVVLTGERTFDDGYDRVAEGAVFALTGGGRRVEVVFESGFPAAQVFSPPGAGFICFEPMAAPTNALADGSAPLTADYRATWSLRVTAASGRSPSSPS